MIISTDNFSLSESVINTIFYVTVCWFCFLIHSSFKYFQFVMILTAMMITIIMITMAVNNPNASGDENIIYDFHLSLRICLSLPPSLCLIPFLYLTLPPPSLSFSSFLPPTLIPTLSLSISLFLPLFLFHLFTQPPSLRLFYIFPLISFSLSLIHSLSYFLILSLSF